MSSLRIICIVLNRNMTYVLFTRHWLKQLIHTLFCYFPSHTASTTHGLFSPSKRLP
jgi:hypothetical protein